MSASVIDGKAVAAEVREKVAGAVANIKSKHDVQPALAVVLVGEDPASEVYVRNKHVATEKSGMRSIEHKLPENASEDEVVALVRKLNEDGMTIILTTHYLEEAEAMCDDIAIINHGEVIIRDSTANLLGRLDRKTLVITPETDADLPALPDTVLGQKLDNGCLTFTYQSGVTPAGQILSLVQDAGITIKDVKTEQADLQDVFLSLTSAR